jgi:hypothetical protein
MTQQNITETGKRTTIPLGTHITDAAEALEIAMGAYLYGYPLVIMDVTRQISTNVPRIIGPKAPVNQINHLRTFPDYTFTDVVTPNADTLYSFAWLDLTHEPQILGVPDTGKRYYLMQMLDAWTNVFASPGTRTTGNGKGHFALVGPSWKGALPPAVQEIRSPTHLAWMIGRTQTNGVSDYPAVHAIQDQYQLMPLSNWGKPYTLPTSVAVQPGIDMTIPPVKQVAAMNATEFFGRLNALMKSNPPAAADASALVRFAKIGIEAGKPFELQTLDAPVANAVERSIEAAQLEITGEAMKPHGQHVNGWDVLPRNTANFGTDYPWRACVALVGLGANLPVDAIYPHAIADVNGEPLHGANRYRVRFAQGELPPVKAFWSLTMYNAQQTFIKNVLNRYSIGDRDPLVADADGNVTIHIQADSPGKDKESNWLPAPCDSFNIFMRLYWPAPAILDGTWKMPPIERVV